MTEPTTLTATRSGRIDTHQHFMPDVLRTYLESSGRARAGGGGLTAMERRCRACVHGRPFDRDRNHVGIRAGCLFRRQGEGSASRSRGERIRSRCRARSSRAVRFLRGAHATDVEGAVAETRYAYDTTARGRASCSSQIRKGSISATSPSSRSWRSSTRVKPRSSFIRTSFQAPQSTGFQRSRADFLLDTTRAAILLAKSGVLKRYPGSQDHLVSCGVASCLTPRIALRCWSARTTRWIPASRLMKKFYFDTALSTSPSGPSQFARFRPNRIGSRMVRIGVGHRFPAVKHSPHGTKRSTFTRSNATRSIARTLRSSSRAWPPFTRPANRFREEAIPASRRDFGVLSAVHPAPSTC